MFEKTSLWAIESLSENRLTTLASLLERERMLNPEAKAIADFTAGPALDAAQSGLPIKLLDNVAIIPVRGIMLKSYAWPSDYVSSTAHVRLAIKAARLDNTIDAILIIGDTPGGDVRGLPELGDEIAAAAQTKPTVVQIEGSLASAGYWMAARATSIFANHKMNSIGSIGVRTVLWDSSEMYEKAGIKVIKVDTGEHKSTGLDGVQVTEEQQAEVQRVVNELYAEFLSVIQAGRKLSKEQLEPLADGRSWFAYDALKHKLIDGIQSLETTLNSLPKPKAKPAPRLTRAQAEQMFSGFKI